MQGPANLVGTGESLSPQSVLSYLYLTENLGIVFVCDKERMWAKVLVIKKISRQHHRRKKVELTSVLERTGDGRGNSKQRLKRY